MSEREYQEKLGKTIDGFLQLGFALLSEWWMKRGLRKRRAPEWAVWGLGNIAGSLVLNEANRVRYTEMREQWGPLIRNLRKLGRQKLNARRENWGKR